MIISIYLLVVALFAGMIPQADAAIKDCTVPSDNMRITNDTTLCRGTYSLPDSGKDGVLQIVADNVTLDCNFATMIGAGGEEAGTGISVAGGSEGKNNINIRNCTTEAYGANMSVGNASNVVIENNTFWISDRAKGLQLGNQDRAVSNITVRNNTFSGVGNGLSYGGSTYQASNIRIENNLIDVTIDGIVISGGSHKNAFYLSGNTYGSAQGEIIGLHESDNSVIQNETVLESTHSNFLVRRSDNVTVRNNKLEKAGFQIEESSDGLYNANFTGRGINVSQGSRRNLFTNNTTSTDENWSMRVSDSTENMFVNNTFYAGDNYTVLLEDSSLNNAFRNNIIYSVSETTPIYYVAPDSTSGFASDYNDLYTANGGFKLRFSDMVFTDFSVWQDLSGHDRHSISKDPRFEDLAREEFHLRPNSPAIDKGDSEVVLPWTDMDGQARPQGADFDIGADELADVDPNGVRLQGNIEFTQDDGFVAMIAIMDNRNPDSTEYAITPNNGESWIQPDGSLGAKKYFSAKKTWEHRNIPMATTNVYRVSVAEESGADESALSNCGLVLSTPSNEPNWVRSAKKTVSSAFSRRGRSANHQRSNIHAAESNQENQYQCSNEPAVIGDDSRPRQEK